jgi:hypothetical protein
MFSNMLHGTTWVVWDDKSNVGFGKMFPNMLHGTTWVMFDLCHSSISANEQLTSQTGILLRTLRFMR